MSYIRYIKQTRPNTDTAFFSPTAEVVAKMDEYQSAGKIESYNLETISADQLSKEIKITFDNVTSFNEFISDLTFLFDKAIAYMLFCFTYLKSKNYDPESNFYL